MVEVAEKPGEVDISEDPKSRKDSDPLKVKK